MRAGLDLEIDGSDKFIRSIREINSELRENYSSMRLSQDQMDKNASKVDRMTSKNVAYRRDLELQEEKVKTLRRELDELSSSEDTNTTALNNKKRSLNDAERVLGNYQKRVEETTRKIEDGTYKWEDFADKLDKSGKSFTSAGKKLLPASAAITGATGLAVKAASDWESAWAGVLKVTDGTPKQLDDIKEGIRELATELPYTAEEVAAVAEEAGKLGVKADDVLVFTETMLDMGVATDLTTTEAATKMAQFANIMNMPLDQVGLLGSSIVDLGNNFATTEPKIMDMALRLAGTGKQAGLSEAQVVAMAAAMSTVGIEAQAGGSSMSKLMAEMQLATQVGGDDLESFAKVAGITADEFKVAFEDDAANAILMFVDGLADAENQGTTAIKMLDDMGIKEVRLRDTLLRLTGANDVFRDSLVVSENAWSENSALTEEAAIRYETFESQLAGLKSTFNELAISFGELLLPVLKDLVDNLKDFINRINDMSEDSKKAILMIGGIIAVIGPLLIVIGKISTGIGALINLAIKLKPVFLAIGGAIKAVAGFVAGLSMGWLLLIAAIIAGVALIVMNWEKVKEITGSLFDFFKEKFDALKEWFTNLKDSVLEGFENFKVLMSEKISQVVEYIREKIVGIKEFFMEIGALIKEKLAEFVNWVIEVLRGPFEFIKNLGILIVALFAIMLEKIWNFLKPGIDKAKELIEVFSENIAQIFEKIKEAINIVIEWFKEHWNNMTQFAGEKATAFGERVKVIFENIKNFIRSVVDKVKLIWQTGVDFISMKIIEPIKTTFTNVFNKVYEIVNGVIDRIKRGFSVMAEAIKTTFVGVRDSIKNIFSVIGGVIKAPINGVITMVNGVIRSLNKIKVPKWVPGLGGAGINFSQIPMLAKGGNLLDGSAIIAESGPELLTSSGGRTTVTPLSDGGGAVKRELIDYDKLAKAMAKALTGVKFALDEDGFVGMIDNRLLEVV